MAGSQGGVRAQTLGVVLYLSQEHILQASHLVGD